MNRIADRSAEWIYGGVWRVLVDCFRVPDLPPKLPNVVQGEPRVFHPSRRYLAYMKLHFWVALVLCDGAIFLGWLAIWWNWPWVGWLLAIPALVVAIAPDIVAYIAIHLRYDTIWYAISDRGIHLRRGIVVITEHTISLANIQNVGVSRGPIEQIFGIATLVIETAGASSGEDPNSLSTGNRVIMVGLDNVESIRDELMTRVRACPAAGLGDEPVLPESPWRPTDLSLLADIRDEIKLL